jgi:uncharacterized repeat protein (TIGR03803 family)
MRGNKVSIGSIALSAILAASLFAVSAAAQTETVLHNFSNNGTDGNASYAGLIIDASGNLYGTTLLGGTHSNCDNGSGCGTAFKLSPAEGGGWTETILHDFDYNGKDGYQPNGSLVFDGAGNLYGTTEAGGTGACEGVTSVVGCGTVFELSPAAGGGWTEKILYSFLSNGRDGNTPLSALVFDSDGNLYGTTYNGGAYNYGTVFELSPRTGGGWTEKVLHSFQDIQGKDGSFPNGSLTFDSAGNLYGTTQNGGLYHVGTAFELTPRAGGGWAETILHNFAVNAFPRAGLIFDAAGNLYGTTPSGGTGHKGTVFELTPAVGGEWPETVLHSFENNGVDGYEPLGSLVFDAKGNLFGTTFDGGTGTCREGCGTVFELTPAAGGEWTETVYSFADGLDGYWPASNLVFDRFGNLYGTTVNGGTDGGCVCGTVFELTP